MAKAIAGYWPDPNRAATITGANNYSSNTRPGLDRDIVVARLDHQFNASNQLMARYFVADSRQLTPGTYPEAIKEGEAGTNSVDQRTQNILQSPIAEGAIRVPA